VSCTHIREELGAYVLAALEPDERDAVAAHLEQCPDCAAEHERLAGMPALLVHAEGLEIPDAPPAVEERVLDAIARERGAGRRVRRPHIRGLLGWKRGRALAVGALAGAALGAGVTAFALQDDTPMTPRSYALVLHGDSGASGRAELAPRHGGTELHMWVKGLPPNDKAVYEVHCERPGWSASAGTFRADSRGRAYVVMTTAARLGEYEAIRVVRRPDSTDVLTGQLD
jgi:hypothetical protein